MKDKNGEHPFGDAGQILLFTLFLFIWLTDSFFIKKTTWLSSAIPVYFRLFVLILSILFAMLLFRSGHAVAHSEHRGEKLVTVGAFHCVRHPLYLASILTYFGLTVMTVSLSSFILLIMIFLFHDFIASYEEKILEKKFGDEYRKYKKKTGKWVPRLGAGC